MWKKLKKAKVSTDFAVMLIIAVIISAGALVWTQHAKWLDKQAAQEESAALQASQRQNPLVSAPTCDHYGVAQSPAKFLPKYITSDGDTPLTIATEKLGDPSRASDIVLLNRAQYPDIRAEGILEKGLEIALPFEGMPKGANVQVTSGHFVKEKDMSVWAVVMADRSSLRSYKPQSPKDVRVPANLRKGECVDVFYTYYPNTYSDDVYFIQRQ